MEPIEVIESNGMKVELHPEHDSEVGNPRECDQLGTMYCWHPDYTLGDERFTERDHETMEAVAFYLKRERSAVCILPLFLLDHSGLSMRTGSRIDPDLGPGHVAAEARTTDRFTGDGQGWDTSMVGFIYTTAERVRELCAEYPFKASDFAGTTDEWLEKQLRDEVEEYDTFLRGEVYFYVVKGADGAHVDSCGGFLGWDHAKQEAQGALEEAVADAKHEAEEVRRWAERDVMTVKGAA